MPPESLQSEPAGPEAAASPGFTPRRVVRKRRRVALAAGFVGVVVAVGLVAATFLLAAGSDDPDVHLGDDTFVVGKAEALTDPIRRDGPLLFKDLVGGDRDIFVQHLGNDPKAGWTAFEARPPGARAACVVAWDRRARRFADPCTDATFPADGTGLRAYPTTVEDDGRVVVDLRSARRSSGTNTTRP